MSSKNCTFRIELVALRLQASKILALLSDNELEFFDLRNVIGFEALALGSFLVDLHLPEIKEVANFSTQILGYVHD